MENEALIRLGVFIGLFTVLALAEHLAPRRARKDALSKRWVTNWSVSIIDVIALRLMAVALPLLAVGASTDATAQGWGLFNILTWPAWIEVLISVLILDFTIWAQHLITHKVPFLWRLHQVHHSDKDIDVTTAIRFHPFEIALSMLLKIGLVYLLGPSAFAVILFEILLNGTSMFNHSNLYLPLRLDLVLRLFLVTPDMHRVHHSVDPAEHDSNYGFALSIWDRMFGTYIPQPCDGHDNMETGLRWQDDKPARLGWTLWLPIRNK